MVYIYIVGRPESPVKPASRVFMSCFWTLTITVIATYSGNLIAFMTVKKFKPLVDSLEELVANPGYQAGITPGTSNSDLFRVSL